MERRAQFVLTDVMVQHHFVGRRRFDHRPHVADLSPRRGVQNQNAVLGAIGGQFVGLDVRAQVLELTVGIDECEVGRRRMGVDDADRLSGLLQHPFHPQLAAQRVTIRADVADQQKRLVFLNLVDERVPIDTHGGAGEGGAVKA